MFGLSQKGIEVGLVGDIRDWHDRRGQLWIGSVP